MADPTIIPVFAIPEHPGFPSGHACASGATASVLSYLLPSDAGSFAAMSQDAGNSTFYAAIHTMFDVAQGFVLGQQVGQQVVQHAQTDERTIHIHAETSTYSNHRVCVSELVPRREQIYPIQPRFRHCGSGQQLDPCLINPWGIVASPSSPFWISANGTGLATL